MQELIGQIAATVIGGVIILILAVIAWRGQSHAVGSVQYSSAKESILDFAEVMEEDLSNMGAGLMNNDLHGPSSYGGFYGASSFNATTPPYSFKFYSWTDRSDPIDPTQPHDSWVEYEWEETGNVQVFDPTTNSYVATPTYQIKRTVKTATGSATPSGESMDSLTEVAFIFWGDDPATNPETWETLDVEGDNSLMKHVRAVQVTLRAVSPLGGGTGYVDANDPATRGQIDQTRWSRMIRPHNLTRVPN